MCLALKKEAARFPAETSGLELNLGGRAHPIRALSKGFEKNGKCFARRVRYGRNCLKLF
jgi:hypothetical protein